MNRTLLLSLALATAIAMTSAQPAYAQGKTKISALQAKPSPSPSDVIPLIDASGNPYKTTVAQLLAGVPAGTTSGTFAAGNDSRITGAEQTANKGVANGYAPLGADSKVLTANQPSLTDPRTIAGLVMALDADTPNTSPPTIYAQDSFIRTDSTSVLGTTDISGSKTWTTRVGTMGISSNKAYASALTSSVAIATIDTGTQDAQLEADVLVEFNNYHGFVFRYVDSSNYLSVRLSNFVVNVYKTVAGTTTNLGGFSTTTTSTTGATVHLVVRLVGGELVCAVDGVSHGGFHLTSSDAALFSSTMHGLLMSSTNARASNFTALSAYNEVGLGITKWEDRANAGWTITNGDAAHMLTLLSPGGVSVVRNNSTANGGMDITHPFFNAGEMTVITVGKTANPSATQCVFATGKYGVTSQNALMFANGEITPYDGNSFATGIPAPTTDTIFGMVASASFPNGLGSGVKAFGNNGCSVFRYNDNSGGPATWSGNRVQRSVLYALGGSSTTTNNYFLNGDTRRQYVYNRALTDTEIGAASRWLANALSVTAPSLPTVNIVIDGDSLSTNPLGSGVLSGHGYPDKVAAGLTAKYKMHNIAVHGQTAAAMAADLSTQLAALYDPTAINIYIPWGGTNDIASTPGNPGAVFTSFKSCGVTAKGLHYAVAAITCPPRGTASQFETDRIAFNTSIRNDTSFYDALVDVGADATIGVAGAQNNTTYYSSDKIHLTSAGYAIVATGVTSALSGMGVH